MPFYNREPELRLLRARWRTRKAELLIVYGRRRVGKTELLKHFIRGKEAIYFLADRRPEREQLKALAARLGDAFRDELVGRHGFSDWLEVFTYLNTRVKKRLILVIDEYPYLVENNHAVSSLFQKGWDETLRDLPLCLILCGSSIGMMESETLAHRAPLFGRRTGDVLVEPLDFFSARAFFPRAPFERALENYAVLGGMPAYLAQFDFSAKLETNVRKQILTPGTFLFREVDFLLREELREPRYYLSILKAIAFGHRKFGEIVNDTGLEKNVLHKYLAVLEDLRLVSRETPVTETAPHRSKRGLYLLQDALVAFWMEYVYPFVSDLALGDPTPSLRQFRKTFLHRVSGTYEHVARDLLRRRRPSLHVQRVGRWWDRNQEVDIVGVNEETREIVFGEVKWTTRPVGTNVLRDLKEKARLVSWGGQDRRERYALFSKSGFTPELRNLASRERVMLFHKDRLIIPLVRQSGL